MTTKHLILPIVALGSQENCDITYTPTGSGCDYLDALRAFRNYGYSNASIQYGPFSFTQTLHSSVRDQLFDGHPVFCCGFSGNDTGHAWVIDGYYAGLYHINWGYRGFSDGYYLAGVFDLSQRQGLASMDSIYEYTPENYSYGYAIITF